MNTSALSASLDHQAEQGTLLFPGGDIAGRVQAVKRALELVEARGLDDEVLADCRMTVRRSGHYLTMIARHGSPNPTQVCYDVCAALDDALEDLEALLRNTDEQ